jgi:hypothetical protein
LEKYCSAFFVVDSYLSAVPDEWAYLFSIRASAGRRGAKVDLKSIF